jgi:hypothetical protein
MELRLGPLPVLKTLRDKEPFSPAWRDSERTGDCPLAGRRHWVIRFRFRRSGSWWPYQFYLLSKADKSKSTFRTSARLGSSFLDNPGLNSRWFHHPGEHLFQGFDLGHPVQPKLLEIPSQRVHQPALVAIELA